MSTNYNKIAIVLGSAALFFACKSSKVYEVPTAVRPYAGKTIAAPPGMVYVPSGTIFEKSTIKDSINTDTTSRRVSLSAFFIDETEVSNKQYRKFVDWVADSVAVSTYFKNDPKYFYNAKVKSKAKVASGGKGADSTARRINWSKIDINSKVPFWQTNSEKLGPMVSMSNGRKVLNKDLVKFAFTHVQAGGPNAGKSVTDTIKVMPDNNVWTEDFPNSQSDFLVNNYFTIKGFDNYPVVGVTWKQARAYAYWRGIVSGSQEKSIVDMGLTFGLPTEAQWEYAASGGERNTESGIGNNAKDVNVVPSYINKKAKRFCLLLISNKAKGTIPETVLSKLFL